MRRTFPIVLVLAAALAVAWAEEEEAKSPEASVEALIQEGLAAYKAGKHQVAIDRLQKAIGLIQEASAKGLESFLPQIGKGWKADAPRTHSGSWGAGREAFQWTQVVRTYRREKDGLKVEVTLSNSPQMLAGQRQALQAYANPQMLEMMNRDPNQQISLVHEAGWDGWTIQQKGKRMQTIAICKSILLILDVDADEPEVHASFWKALDKKGIAAAASEEK
jgi:hypothetical protein